MGTTAGRRYRYPHSVDDRRAALVLALLAVAGAGARWLLAPRPDAPPGDVRLSASDWDSSALHATARRATQLARPLLPGERVDLDRADVTEITRLPRIGPSLAQRIVAWRSEHGPFGSVERFDSVPGVGPALLSAVRPFVMFSGVAP